MGSLSPDQLYRIIAPLVDAGMELEQIRVLLFRLAFEAITSDGSATATSVATVVHDQPPEIQAAWRHVIGRMIDSETSGAADS